MIWIIDDFSVPACKMAMICLCPTIKEQHYEFLSLLPCKMNSNRFQYRDSWHFPSTRAFCLNEIFYLKLPNQIKPPEMAELAKARLLS